MGQEILNISQNYEKAINESIENQPYDIEKLRMSLGNQQIFCTAHSPNELLMFLLDPLDEQVKILTSLRPHKSFLKRLCIAVGYLFSFWWPYDGDWNMFVFNKDDAERLIAFLRKVV